jgi:hypothetical protein
MGLPPLTGPTRKGSSDLSSGLELFPCGLELLDGAGVNISAHISALNFLSRSPVFLKALQKKHRWCKISQVQYF